MKKFILVIFSLLLSPRPLPAQGTHPLDPLNAPEIDSVVQILKTSGKFQEGMLFPHVVLQEPPKKEVLAFKLGAAFRREALVVVFDRKTNKTYEALVDIAQKKLVSWTYLPGTQPNILLGEFAELPAVVRGDTRWQEAMKKRGIQNPQDPNEVWVDIWAPGPLSKEERERNVRLVRAVSYLKKGTENPYARPIEGVVALVNANTWTVEEPARLRRHATSANKFCLGTPGNHDPAAIALAPAPTPAT